MPVAPVAPRLWFADGTIVDAVPQETPVADVVAIQRVGRPGDATQAPTVDVDTIRGFAPRPARLLPLAELAPTSVRASGPTPRFAVTPPEVALGRWPLDGAAVTLDGPLAVDYDLPTTDCMFLAEIAPAAPDARWTACEVVFRDGDREALRIAIDARTPPTWLHVPLTSRRMEIEVTEGERGPVADAIRMRYAFIVVPAQ